MGFMDRFKQPQQSSQPIGMLSAAQKIVGNDPRAALKVMADSGMTCNLPNGKTMSVNDLLSMAEGKTAQQLLDQLGIR